MARYRRSARSEPPRQTNWGGLMAFTIVVMAAALAAGGYSLYRLHLQLERNEAVLARMEASNKDLEARLAATGTDTSKAFRDVDGRVQQNYSEIDKLWAVAYRQNKPEIQQNAQAIEKLELQMQGRLVAMDGTVQALNGQLASLQEQQALREAVLQDPEEVITQLSLLQDQAREQAVALEALQRQGNSLRKTMKEVQADIVAINGFRANFNERLLDLER